MNDADEWTTLQDTWGSTARAGVPAPDVASMIARARRQRRRIVWTTIGEWALALVAMALLVDQWPRVTAGRFMMAWWVFFSLVMGAVLIGATWTRLSALREPAGASLRDWLQLRRRRALLGLRLARLTRWSTVAMLPAPLVLLASDRNAWAAIWGTAALLLLLAGGWLWARHKTGRMKAEIADVDALARDWLDEPPAH